MMIRASSSCCRMTPVSTTLNCGNVARCRMKSKARMSPALRRSLRLTNGTTATEYLAAGIDRDAAKPRPGPELRRGLRSRAGRSRLQIGGKRIGQPVEGPDEQRVVVVLDAQLEESWTIVARHPGVVRPRHDRRACDRDQPDDQGEPRRHGVARQLDGGDHHAGDTGFLTQRRGGRAIDAGRVADAMARHERFELTVVENRDPAGLEPRDKELPHLVGGSVAAAEVFDREHRDARDSLAGARRRNARERQAEKRRLRRPRGRPHAPTRHAGVHDGVCAWRTFESMTALIRPSVRAAEGSRLCWPACATSLLYAWRIADITSTARRLARPF